MKYPFTSFSIAFFICFVLPCLLFFSFKNKEKQKLIPATVEIDSIFIAGNEQSIQKENQQIAVKQKLEDKVLDKEGEEKLLREEQNKALTKHDNKASKKFEKNNHQQKNQEAEKKLLVLYGPLPQIPDHLKSETLQTYAMARFYVAKDGSAKVKLIKASSNPELNYLLLKNLMKWKFEPSNQDSVQDIRVNFKVESEEMDWEN